MSFSTSLRWVKNDGLPVKARVNAFCWVIESYCWLTHSRFQEVLAELEQKHGFALKSAPGIERVLNAVLELEQLRSAFLIDVSNYRTLRRLQKGSGIRKPLRADKDPRNGRP